MKCGEVDSILHRNDFFYFVFHLWKNIYSTLHVSENTIVDRVVPCILYIEACNHLSVYIWSSHQSHNQLWRHNTIFILLSYYGDRCFNQLQTRNTFLMYNTVPWMQNYIPNDAKTPVRMILMHLCEITHLN